MKKSTYFDQNGFIETMNEYEHYFSTIYKTSKVIIDYNGNVLSSDNGCFKFDNITFDYRPYNLFQMVKLWIRGEVIATLFFEEKDIFKIIYKDEFVFCNCNRNLECLVAKYRKLKGGEQQ